MPTLSIVVPIYNVQNYLQKCIDSILAQTYKDFELILINDGSTDSCFDICKYYQRVDQRVIFINQKNQGVSAARNKGMEAARGEYIGFVDPDDTIEPTMYEILMKSAQEYDVDIVVCPIKRINMMNSTFSVSSIWRDVNTVIDKKSIQNYILPSILGDITYSLISSVNKVYRMSVLDSFKIRFDEMKTHSEDARFNFTLLTNIDTLLYVEQPLYNYFVRNRDSLTRKFREDFYKYMIDNKKFLIELCDMYQYQQYKEQIRSKYTLMILSHIQDIVSREIPVRNKHKILSEILNDNDFKEDISKIKGTTMFTKLLKTICLLKNEKLLLKVIEAKLNLQNLIARLSN